jgi:hypothetical protein
MRCQLAIAVVGATLIAGLGSGIAAPRSDRIEELLQIATGVGRASSAASVCREISWPRIKVLTDNFSDLIKAYGAARQRVCLDTASLRSKYHRQPACGDQQTD